MTLLLLLRTHRYAASASTNPTVSFDARDPGPGVSFDRRAPTSLVFDSRDPRAV